MIKIIENICTDKKARKWSLKIQTEFFESLSDMLKSGFSLKQCIYNLKILYPKLNQDLENALQNLNQGALFSDSIRDYLTSGIYNQLLIAECHGQLILSVAQLGKYLRQRVDQREKLKGILVYPIILVGLLLGMLIIFTVWLKPTLSTLDLTGSTSNLQKIYLMIFKTIGIIGSILILIYLLKIFIWWKNQKNLSRHVWYSQLPLIGQIYRFYSYYYLSFNLALLLKSGLNLQDICKFTQKFESKSLIFELGAELDRHLKQGKQIENFINKYSFIPSELTIFINKGQTDQQISKDLLIYSQTMYQRLLRKIDKLINMIQPILFLIIALIILAVYLSILLPMYYGIGEIYQ